MISRKQFYDKYFNSNIFNVKPSKEKTENIKMRVSQSPLEVIK